MKILIKNGRVIDPGSNFDKTCDVAVAAGRIVSVGAAPGQFRAQPRDRRQGLHRRARAGGPGRAPARARPRARGHAGKRDGSRRGGRRDQPRVPARHRPGARRTGIGGDAEIPRREAAPGAGVPAGRAHAQPAGRSAHRDDGAHRSGLRRLQPGRGAAGEHAGAAARAAVRGDLRLRGVAAPAGIAPGQGRGRERRAGHAPGPRPACPSPPRPSRCTRSSS